MECFVPGRLIVGPDPEADSSEYLLDELRDISGGNFELDFNFAEVLAANEVFPEFHEKGALPFVGRVPEGSEWEFAERLGDHPVVKAAIPDFTVRPSASCILNPGAINAALKQIGGIPPGVQCGGGCRIAVLDTGVDSALLSNAKVSPMQMDARNPHAAMAAPSDTNGHGTTVAAIIAAVAPGAEIVPIKVLDGTGSISNVLVGLYLARNAHRTCDLINLSLSIDCWSNNCPQCYARAAAMAQPQLEFLFAGALRGSGDVVAIAAGGKNIKSLAAPAIFPDVIGVGSFDYGSNTPKSSFPNVPSTRYVMAPGGEPNANDCFGDTGAAGLSRYLEGTSFATAFVTGFAARVVCNLKRSDCGSALKQPGGRRSDYFQSIVAELAARSDRSFAAFDSNLHGIGALRF